ncbi:T9SS type A sorting domain-containing protein [candidate division WOR-3 bacterium]|nr:T9SS type A sorting domain-containing protein [candidate division WOR-3 bacterium]
MKILKYCCILLLFVIPSLLRADFPICIQDSGQGSPAVAWGDTNYFVIWEDGRYPVPFNSPDIYRQFVTSAGTLIDTNFLVGPDAGAQSNPTLAYDGTNYLIVWEEGNFPSLPYIYAQLVSSEGVPIDNSFPVCDTEAMEPTVCWNGTNYLIVWRDARNNFLESDIYGQIVLPNGALLDTNFAISIAPEEQRGPSIASDGTNYLVVWSDGRNWDTNYNDIYAQLIFQNGTLIDTNFAVSSSPNIQSDPVIAWNGVNYLVVWLEYGVDIYGQFISSEGNLIDSNFIISARPNDQRYPSIACDSVNHLVIWQEGHTWDSLDIYGQFVSQNGSLVDTIFAISTAPYGQHMPAVDCSGEDYLVVWQDGRDEDGVDYDIYGNIIQTLGVEETIQDTRNKSGRLKVFPNPFISYVKIIGMSHQEVEIYDISGQIVQRIKDSVWNGRNKNNKETPPGIYFLKAKEYKTVKVIKLR